jgi:hypothetical protein
MAGAKSKSLLPLIEAALDIDRSDESKTSVC